jgi:hypothetical protein
VWKVKEIEENFTLDFALDGKTSNLLIFSIPLILYGFLSFGLKLFYLTILPHDVSKVLICQNNVKKRENQIKKEW